MEKTIVLLATANPGLLVSFNYLEALSDTVTQSLGKEAEIHLLMPPNISLNIPPRENLKPFYLYAETSTDLIVKHLNEIEFSRAFRVSHRFTLSADNFRMMADCLEENPDALVFADYDEKGRLVADCFQSQLFSETEQFAWTHSSNHWAAAWNLESDGAPEYFQISSIPRQLSLKTYGPDQQETEEIVNCRLWFSPVKIKNRTTFCSKPQQWPLDSFLLYKGHKFFTDKKVLEVGCWEGAFGSLALDAGAKHVHFTDTPLKDVDWRHPHPLDFSDDPSMEMTIGEKLGTLPLVLKNRDPEKCKFSRANVYDLQSLGATYDVSIFGGITYHIYDPMKAIEQVCKVTKEVVVLGSTILQSREPVAYLQEPLETAKFDPTTWFQISYPMFKMLFAHNGFDRAAMLGGYIPHDGSWKTRDYKYMVFYRTQPMN